MRRWIVWTVLSLSLTACATPPAAPPAAETPAPPAAAQPAGDSALYHVLSAEMAVRQGDFPQALKSYLAAARLSDDPRLAERAARLAIYLGERDAGLEAAERWHTLAPQDAEPYEVLAVLELRTGTQAAALSQLREFVTLSRAAQAEPFERLAEVLVREKDKAAAVALMQALVAEYPKELAAQMALAELALQARQPDEALRAAERAAALDPKSAEPLLLQARVHIFKGDTDTALKLMERGLRQHPKDYDLRLLYARTLLALQKNEAAAKQFEILVAERPDDAQLLYAAGLLAAERGDIERARKHLLAVMNTGERTDEAAYYLGRLAQVDGDHKGALRWFRQVRGEYEADAQLRIALVLAAQGDHTAALSKLRDVRRDYPEAAARSYIIEAEILREQGKTEAAYEVYGQGLAAYPDDWELRYARALIGAQLGHLEEAEADLRALLAKRPDSAQALNALGYTLVDRTDRHQEGYELIKKAFELRPDDPAIIDSMGWASYRLGKLKDARAYLEQAHRLSKEGEIAAHYAEVLWQLKERKLARKVLNEALKRAPMDAYLLETKKRLQ